MAASDECIRAIRDAFAGERELSDEEVEALVDAVNERAGQTGDFARAAQDVARDVQEAAFIERRNRRINVSVKQRLLAMASEADERYNDPSAALEAAIYGINRPIESGRLSADAKKQALESEYLTGMIAELRRNDLLTDFNSGHMDLDVARALEALTDPEARGTQSRAAQRIAEIVHKHRKIAFDRRNRAGAWTKELRGRVTRQSHDMDKLRRAGFDEWKSFITPLLHPRTFRGVEDADAMLREAFNTLQSGEQFRTGEAETDLRLAFKGPGNLARRRSEAHRALHFKDADSWGAYNERFGFRSLRESLVAEFRGMARDTSLFETFGTNPRVMFEEVRSDLRQRHRGEPKKKNDLDRSIIEAGFDVIEGRTSVPASPRMANISAGVRALESMSSLGGATLSSIADIANKAAAIRYTDGSGVFSPVLESLTSTVEAFSGRDKRTVAELIGVGVDGQIGDISARFSADDSIAGTGNRWLRAFFKLNLLTPWTEGNKRGMGLILSRRLAMHKNRRFASLPERQQFLFRQFGIGEREWDIARRGVRKAEDGREYLFPDEVSRLTDVSQRERDTVQTALRAFIVDTTETAVPTPGARERAILTRGFRAGTPEGEAARFLTQFKSFPVTVMTKTLGKLAYSNPDGRFDKAGLAMYIASATALGYVAMSAKDLAKGRTPRDPLSVEAVTASFVQGGGAGIYGDFLFGEYNRFGRSLAATAVGPTFGTVDDVAELFARLRAGEDAAGTAFYLGTNNLPGINLFYTRAALDYLILHSLQESMNPGYLRRAERRLKREQNQTYLIPPSRVTPRGGGNILLGALE